MHGYMCRPASDHPMVPRNGLMGVSRRCLHVRKHLLVFQENLDFPEGKGVGIPPGGQGRGFLKQYTN